MKRQAWQHLAENIFIELQSLNGIEQSEVFRIKLNEIDDQNARSAIELLVWNWLKTDQTVISTKPSIYTSTNMIIMAVFMSVFLIGWWELNITPIFAFSLALFTAIIIRLIFRMFDRGFMFRRLFIACIGSGLLLIVPSQLKWNFATPFGSIEWGGEPSFIMLIIWLLCTLLTFFAAVWEHKISNRN